MEVLVVLTVLAALAFWIVGLAARALNLARHLQANTETSRPVLSTPFIGRQLILRREAHFPVSLLNRMLLELRRLFSLALPA